MKLNSPLFTLPVAAVSRLARLLWIKLSVAVIVLLLVVLGVQLSYSPDGSAPSAAVRGASTVKTVKHIPAAEPAQTTPETTPAVAAATPPAPAAAPVPHPSGARPAANKSLVFSQSTVTLYKATPAPGLKQLSTTAPLIITTSDGTAVNLPIGPNGVATLLVTTQDPTPYKTSWPTLVSSVYSSIGTFTYNLSAISAKGAVYTGSIQVVVKPIPLFMVSATGIVINAVGDDVTVDFTGGVGVGFDLSQAADYMPTLTIAIAGVSCSFNMALPDSEPVCNGATDIDLPPGTYSASCTFENQFQHFTLQGVAYIN